MLTTSAPPRHQQQRGDHHAQARDHQFAAGADLQHDLVRSRQQRSDDVPDSSARPEHPIPRWRPVGDRARA
jgi:hypothetical protein